MNKIFISALIALVLFSVSCKGSNSQASGQQDVLDAELLVTDPKGKKMAPDFELLDLKNNKFVLSNYKDKNPVLLFFWTTECPICSYEIPVLNKMHPDLMKEGLVVASVNVGEEAGIVVDYMRAYPDALYPVLLDKSYAVARKYKVFGVPTYILIDKSGGIVFTGHSFSPEKFRKLIH